MNYKIIVNNEVKSIGSKIRIYSTRDPPTENFGDDKDREYPKKLSLCVSVHQWQKIFPFLSFKIPNSSFNII
jgi:hypothetical protein